MPSTSASGALYLRKCGHPAFIAGITIAEQDSAVYLASCRCIPPQQSVEHLTAPAVLGSWHRWVHATHRRNDCLADVADVFSSLLPQEELFPHHLHRLVGDSERSLKLLQEPGWGGESDFLPGEEWQLQEAARRTLLEAENNPPLRNHESLQLLCSQMSVALNQQEQYTRLFNRAAQEYNAALNHPSGRIVAPIFGFLRAQNLRSQSGSE